MESCFSKRVRDYVQGLVIEIQHHVQCLRSKRKKNPLANIDNKVQWYVNVFSLQLEIDIEGIFMRFFEKGQPFMTTSFAFHTLVVMMSFMALNIFCVFVIVAMQSLRSSRPDIHSHQLALQPLAFKLMDPVILSKAICEQEKKRNGKLDINLRMLITLEIQIMATYELNNHNCFQKLLFVYSRRALGDDDKQCLVVGAGSSEW